MAARDLFDQRATGPFECDLDPVDECRGVLKRAADRLDFELFAERHHLGRPDGAHL